VKRSLKRIRDHRGVILKPIHEEHEPIPGDIEARFTKDKVVQELHQVFVEMESEQEPVAVSPKMLKPFCEEVLAAFNKAVIDGKAKGWGNPHIARAA
jgi:hypothetical protein